MCAHAPRCSAAFIAACLTASVLSAAPEDEEETATPLSLEPSGRLSAESRVFPLPGILAGQQSLATGFVAEPTLHVDDPDGPTLTLAPFFRYDGSDPRRSHFDLREAYLLLAGDAGATGGWEAGLGVGQVFWGVTESQRLVDVINQVDLVEHPDGEAKLGQPMAHVTWFGDWGAIEVIAMPLHRARTFPGRHGRLRLPLVVAHDRVEYDSPRHGRPDFATRYNHSLGALDLGVSAFQGIGREPFLQSTTSVTGEPVLVQQYGEIRQLGLDAQWTVAAWLLKAECIQRSNSRNRLGIEQDLFAAVLGVEYAFHSPAARADVSLLAEWSYDSRGSLATPGRSPNTFDNDAFLGARFAFDDVQSTELTASLVADVTRPTRALALGFARRITNTWSLRAEALALVSVDEAEIHYAMRHDSFFDMSLIYSF